MSVKLVVDSVSAPSLRRVEELDITIVPIHVHFGTRVYDDLLEMTPEQFYRELVAAKELPTTSAPSFERFASAFEQILRQGHDVACLTVSSKFSATYGVAVQARQEFSGEDAARIRVIDLETEGSSCAVLSLEAARLCQAGATLDEVESRLRALIPNARFLAMLDTLSFIAKSGKIGKVQAVAGDLFRVKPVACIQHEGVQFIGRARGKRQAIEMMLGQFAQDVRGREDVLVTVTHANAEADLPPLIQGVEAACPGIDIDVAPFTAGMGVHAGPGLLGIAYAYL